MNSQYRKLIVGVGLLVVAGGLFVYFRPQGSPFPSKRAFVCVATGEVFRFSESDAPGVVPGKNPKTGERTLLPAEVGADGKVLAKSRYARSALQDPELARVNRYVDPKTFELLAAPRPQSKS